MTTAAESVPKHDPLAAHLTSAGAGIKLDEWDRYIPPRRPIVPHIRIGKRWINILWAALPIALGLIIPIAVAQGLRNIPVVEAFFRRYPDFGRSSRILAWLAVFSISLLTQGWNRCAAPFHSGCVRPKNERAPVDEWRL